MSGHPVEQRSFSSPRRRAWLRAAAWIVAVTCVYFGAAHAGRLVGDYLLSDVNFPLPPMPTLPMGSRVLARGGERITTFALENRDSITYAEVSPHVVNGLIAVEDAHFREHHGFNFRGIALALVADAWASAKVGRPVFPQGGSSLTQQLAKLLYTDQSRTAHRKREEALYALHLEKNFSKDEILEMYLNKVNLGAGYHGVEAASQFYFGKRCKDLSLAEGAMLAGIGQSPARLSPSSHPDKARRRRDHVLDRMVATKSITPREAADAKAQPVLLASNEGGRVGTGRAAPYFLEEVRRRLADLPGARGNVNTGGLKVQTTLDMSIQGLATRVLRQGLRQLDKTVLGFRPITRNVLRQGEDLGSWADPLWELPLAENDVRNGVVLESGAEEAIVRIGSDRIRVDAKAVEWSGRKSVSDVLHRGDVAPFRVLSRAAGSGMIERVELEQDPVLEGALVAIDVPTGEILAMVGGFDFNRSEFNKATQARRQPGSCFKPIYYSIALEKGRAVRPTTVVIDEPTVFMDAWTGREYRPENSHRGYHGTVTLRESLALSLNIPSVRLLNFIGYADVIAASRKFGLTAPLRPYPSMALGAQEMTLLELTSAYSTFPNAGIHVRPTLIRSVKDARGRAIYSHQLEAVEVLSPQSAFEMVKMMRGVVEEGTATAARRLGRPLAGKTGTTDDYTDAWFIGYTPSIVVGVWTGLEDEAKGIAPDYSGARAALPIWIAFMEEYLKDKPVEEFVDPGETHFASADVEEAPSPSAEDDSVEALMRADPRTTADGLHADFDVLDGRTVMVVRNVR